MKEKRIFLALFAAVLSASSFGCTGLDSRNADQAATSPPREIPLDVDGTVGQYARLHDGGYMPVKGYGLVIRLGSKGSTEVPPHLREYLIKDMSRGIGRPTMATGDISPDRVLSSIDTAVVVVRGLIPPRALEGDSFDVVVTAHSATGTQSLDGGILMPTRLKLDLGSEEGDPESGSKEWAVASGPIMINPFVDASTSSASMSLREGRIVGGGKVSRDRKISLMMIRPDFQLADLIQRQINSRFRRGDDRIANAGNREVVELRVPPTYEDDQLHFVQLVTHLPLNNSAAAWEIRARSIVAEMANPEASHESLALVLEAQGGQVIPLLRPLYNSDIKAAAFFAARAAMRLGDSAADEIILGFAETVGSPYQIPAIEALGRHAGMPRADLVLRDLLNDENSLVRTAAHNALVRRGSRAVLCMRISEQFDLDVVKCDRNNMIYASQVGEPRIILFGNDITVGNPVFFNAPDDLVTVNANQGSDQLTVWRKVPVTGGISDKFRIPFDVASLVQTLGSIADYGPDGEIAGLGLTYGQVVGVLYRMCQQGCINAEFVLEPVPAEQLMLQGVEDFVLLPHEDRPARDIEGDLHIQQDTQRDLDKDVEQILGR